MPMDVVLVLGYDSMGSVAAAIQAIKSAAMIPIAVLNETGADYSRWLPRELILSSWNVNRDHRALIREIRRIGELLGQRRLSVRAIINEQDRMWLCYLDLCRAFPEAAGIPPSAIIKTSVKPNLRFLLRSTRYHVPYVLLPRRHLSAARLLRFPPLHAFAAKARAVIVKPVVGAGGVGVTRVDNEARFEEDLRYAAEKALALQGTTYGSRITAPFLELGSRRHPVSDFVLIEQYIEGHEYSLEGLAGTNGGVRYLVEQKKTKRLETPIFRDLEYLVCDAKPSRNAEDAICALLRGVGYDDFPFHIELKGSAKSGLRPVEFNPRVGGGSIGDLVTAIHGVDLRQLGTKRTLDRLRLKRKFVTVVVQPQKTGKIMRYKGVEKIQRQIDCVFIRKLVPEGTEIERLDRETYLIEFCVAGKDAASAQRRANQLLSWIYVDIVSPKPLPATPALVPVP